jgi:UDP-N-acetylglucosamine 2-epimerase
VVSAHREENIDSDTNFGDLLATLQGMAERYRRPIIVSTHPRTRKKLEETGSSELGEGIRFIKPLGFFDYVKLQLQAFCVVSDSGTITEESSILNFPAVTIRQAQERPEGMDAGTLIMCGLKVHRVLDAIDVVTSQQERGRRQFALVPDYDVDQVSQKVVRIILSHIDYVNRTVWHKS